jgi:hypothetical protein
MRNDHDSRSCFDYTYELDGPCFSTTAPASTDYFAFYQSSDRWEWRRVSVAGRVVESSQGGFGHYLQCVADAERHGWPSAGSQGTK